MIGVKPLFSGRSLGEGETATFDVVLVAPDGKTLAAQRPALRAAQDRVALSVVSPRRPLGLRADQAHPPRRRRPHRRCGRPARPHRRAGAMGPLPPRSLERATPNGPVTSIALRRRLVHRSQRRHARHAGDRARQAGIQAGRGDDGRGHGAHRRPRHAQRHGRQAAQHRHPGGAARHRAHPAQRRLATGAPAPMWWRRLRRPLDAQRAAHAGPRHRRAVVLDRPQGARRSRST